MVQEKTILSVLPLALDTLDLNFLGEKKQGKVRDIYICDDKRILITTDRQSAFDVILGLVPFKGQVLNKLSEFWFEQTKDIVQNHMIAVPDPNVMVTHNATSIPVEMIVRGYLSGVTKTSPWYSYQKGERMIYGIEFPDDMHKNQKLWEPIITPTTHPEAGASVHDERLTEDEIIGNGIVEKSLYAQMKKISLALFDRGTKIAAKAGLILVDTKYEFGLVDGKLTLIDEIHTPDSSRFWIKKTYQHRINMEMEPENYDKEFLRLWYAEKGYKGYGTPPPMDHELVVKTAQRYIGVYEKITGKTFDSANYEHIRERIKKNLRQYIDDKPQRKRIQNSSKLTYSQVGDNYDTKDPINKISQDAARSTAKNLSLSGFEEVEQTRGESAFVWDQGDHYMATVLECLGTKNLVADAVRSITGKTYYDCIAHDTVATFINDLTTVGAKPLAVSAYWAVQDNTWLEDRPRMIDFINGWKEACDIAGATWGGGETPTLKGILQPNAVDLAGSAVGIIKPKKRLLSEKKLESGDKIILLKSNGINANGLSLARAVADKLPKGYATKLPDGTLYGEAILTKSNIYAQCIQELLNNGIDLHYITNITGHGLRKIMRSTRPFTYRLEHLFEPQPLFSFIQKRAKLSDNEMYQTFNMGQDYALFVNKKDLEKTLTIIKQCGYQGLDAGYIEKGERKVEIAPKGITYLSEALNLR